MRLIRWSLVFAVIAAGCGDDDLAPPPGTDGGVDAATADGSVPDGSPPPSDGGSFDGAPPPTDGGGEGSDAATPQDAGITDPDFGPLPDIGLMDAGICTGPIIDVCACAPPGTVCTDPGDCSAGETCAPDGCGEDVCQPGGAFCVDSTDCSPGATCDSATGTCTRSGPCTSQLDCAPGYSCDSGTCVNRRVDCEVDGDCPEGFRCATMLPVPAFCELAHRSCGNDDACPVGFTCVDVDGDGGGECQFGSGECSTNADCEASETCGIGSVLATRCGERGPCTDADACAAGDRCLALMGGDDALCVPGAGSCESAADCPEGQLCGVPRGEATLRCIGS
jgi:hypothetical protein